MTLAQNHIIIRIWTLRRHCHELGPFRRKQHTDLDEVVAMAMDRCKDIAGNIYRQFKQDLWYSRTQYKRSLILKRWSFEEHGCLRCRQ